MKTMSVLSDLAQELFDSVSARLDKSFRTSLLEDFDCGEEGVATMRILWWAIDTQTPIDDRWCNSFSDFNYSTTGLFTDDFRNLLATVPRIA